MATRTGEQLLEEWSDTYLYEAEEEAVPNDEVDEVVPKRVSHNDGFSEDSIRLYLREIGRVKMIKPDEEIALARLIAKGDLEAKSLYRLIYALLYLLLKSM